MSSLEKCLFSSSASYLFIYFIYFPHLRTCLLIWERGEWKKKKRERNIDVREKHWLVASPICAPTRDQTHNLGMCPDWESNPRPSGLGDASTNWATLARAIWQFVIRLFGFLILSCVSSSYNLDFNPLLDIKFVNIFSHLVDCLLLMVSIAA